MEPIFINAVVRDHGELATLQATELRYTPEEIRDRRKEYLIPIPDKWVELKEIPDEFDHKTPPNPRDINSFIADLMPNMRIYLKVRVKDDKVISEILSNFVEYMLAPAPSRDNVLRYRLYNPVGKHENVKYYQWFIRTLHFFFIDHFNVPGYLQKFPHLALVSLSKTDAMEPGTASIDHVAAPTENDPETAILTEQVQQMLRRLAYKSGAGRFELAAEQLFVHMLKGNTTKEIAIDLGISTTTVNAWVRKLRAAVTPILGTP